MSEVAKLRLLVGLIVLVGIIRLPRDRKPAGILAGLFLLALPFLPIDHAGGGLVRMAERVLLPLGYILVGIAFFSWRPRWNGKP